MRNEDFFEVKRAFCICRSRVFIVPFWYAIKIKKMKHSPKEQFHRANHINVQCMYAVYEEKKYINSTYMSVYLLTK